MDYPVGNYREVLVLKDFLAIPPIHVPIEIHYFELAFLLHFDDYVDLYHGMIPQ